MNMKNDTSKFYIGLRHLSKKTEYYNPQNIIRLIEGCLELGINSFDHADVYGSFKNEALFGEALKADSTLRERIKLVSKCGLQIPSESRPSNKIKYFEINPSYLVKSIDSSLSNLQTDYIDIYILHRPDYLMNINAIANCMEDIIHSGKVLKFGVSNFNTHQVAKLQSRLSFTLEVNQINISVLNPKHLFDGVLDQCEMLNIFPMAYQTVVGGKLFTSSDAETTEMRNKLESIGKEIGNFTIGQIALAWLLKHPSKISPVIGSLNLNRIKEFVQSTKVNLSQQQWYEILKISSSKEVN